MLDLGRLDGMRIPLSNYPVRSQADHSYFRIESTIDDFYNRWYTTWSLPIGEGECRFPYIHYHHVLTADSHVAHSLPPYVEILVTHTQLSTYGGVINHPTAPLEVKRFFRAAGLSSALNVMRAAIQGESRLKSMPNNTVIMISFAACSALSLSVTPADSKSNLAPSVRNLIAEAADVLERIGITPSHRNGASVLYGRFLRVLIRRASFATSNTQAEFDQRGTLLPEVLGDPALPNQYSPAMPISEPQYTSSELLTEPLHFSAMSDLQIIDAVNRAGPAFGTSIPDVPLDHMMNWDWLDFIDATDFNF